MPRRRKAARSVLRDRPEPPRLVRDDLDALGQQLLHVELRFSPTVWEAEAATAERSVQKLLPEGVEVIAHEPGRLGSVVEY